MVDILHLDDSAPLSLRTLDVQLFVHNRHNQTIIVEEISTIGNGIFEDTRTSTVGMTSSTILPARVAGMSIRLPIRRLNEWNYPNVPMMNDPHLLFVVKYRLSGSSASNSSAVMVSTFSVDMSDVFLKGLRGDLMLPPTWEPPVVGAVGEARCGKSCSFGTSVCSGMDGYLTYQLFEVGGQNNHVTMWIQEYNMGDHIPGANIRWRDTYGFDILAEDLKGRDALADVHLHFAQGTLKHEVHKNATPPERVKTASDPLHIAVIFIPYGTILPSPSSSAITTSFQKFYHDLKKIPNLKIAIWITGDWEDALNNTLTGDMVFDFPFIHQVAEVLGIEKSEAHKYIMLSPNTCKPGFKMTPKHALLISHNVQQLLRLLPGYEDAMNSINNFAHRSMPLIPQAWLKTAKLSLSILTIILATILVGGGVGVVPPPPPPPLPAAAAAAAPHKYDAPPPIPNHDPAPPPSDDEELPKRV